MMLKTPHVAVSSSSVASHRINSTLSNESSAVDQPCEKRFRANSYGSLNESNSKYSEYNESFGSTSLEKTSFSMNVEPRLARDGPGPLVASSDLAKAEADQLAIIGTYSTVGCSSRFREMNAHRFGPNAKSNVIGVALSSGQCVGAGVEVLESCQLCKLPICVFGRYLPCLHAPCLRCARYGFDTTRQCAVCRSPINEILQLPVGTLLVCDIASCRRTFRSLRDMRAHFSEMHRGSVELTDAEFLNESLETACGWNTADQSKSALPGTPNHLLPSALHTAFGMGTNGCGFVQRDESVARQPHMASNFHLVPAYSQQPFGHCIENGVRFASPFAEESFRPPPYGLGRFATPAMAPPPSRLMHHSNMTMTMYPQATQSSPPLRPPPPLLRPFVGAYRPMPGPPFASRPAAPYCDTFHSDGFAPPFVNSPAFNGLPMQSVNNTVGHPWTTSTSNVSHSLF